LIEFDRQGGGVRSIANDPGRDEDAAAGLRFGLLAHGQLVPRRDVRAGGDEDVVARRAGGVSVADSPLESSLQAVAVG